MTRTAIPRAERGTVSSLPKGLTMTRVAIAKALKPNNHDEQIKFAESRWGPNSRAALATKAAVVGLTTGADGGDQMVSDEGASAEFFDLVRAQSIIGRLPNLRMIPFRTATLTMDEGPRVAWAGEGAAKGNSPLKLTRATGLAPLKVAALIVATNELLSQAHNDAELIIRDQLVRALATAVDSAFIDPSNSGSANVRPASVTSGNTQDSPSENLFEWSESYTGDPSLAVILLHPFQAARLSSAARPDIGARGGSWAGFPVITSTAVPDGFAVLMDPTQIAVAMGNAEVRASQNATVEMADSSSMTSATSVAAANMTSMFQTNSTAIIGEVSANWRVVRDNSVVVYDLQSYGLAGGV